MRIAFLCFEAFHRGGIRTYARELLNGIAAAGHRVVLFSPPPTSGLSTGLSNEVEFRPVAAANAPMMSAMAYWWNVPRMFRRVEGRTGQFEIVHSNVYADFLLAKRAASGVRVVTVHHLGGTAAAAAGLGLASRVFRLSSEYGPSVIAEGVCVRRADQVVAVSRFTRDDIVKRYPGIEPERVSIIYLGTTRSPDTATEREKAQLRQDWRISKGERIALAVGRLEDRKGIPFLLRSFALANPIRSAKLLLIGDGKPDAFVKIARRLGVADRVVFTGYVDEATLKVAYRIADVFVHAASMEGFGLAVADAVAIGLPVVATRVGSIPEIVTDEVDGYLVDYGDATAFADALTRALDGTLLPADGRTSRASKKFSWETTVQKTLDLYEKLL